jgi:uncharacterized membrane protein
MKHEKLFQTIKVFAVFGALLSVYLIWQQLAHPAFKPCNINSRVNCDAVVSGSVANTLGIPTPLYGLAGYIVIFFGAEYFKKKLTLGAATFGLLFCLRIAIIEFFQLKVICPVCIGCQLDMGVVFILSLLTFMNPKTTELKDTKEE